MCPKTIGNLQGSIKNGAGLLNYWKVGKPLFFFGKRAYNRRQEVLSCGRWQQARYFLDTEKFGINGEKAYGISDYYRWFL